MTPEDIDKLTIADVRAVVERASAALEQLRQVQSLLGGVVPAGPGVEPVLRAQPSPAAAPVTNKGPVAWSADEQARRAALLATPAFDADGNPS